MAQFDVYRNPHRYTIGQFPLVLDVQVDFLTELQSTVVVPLSRAGGSCRPLAFLMPQLQVDGHPYVMVTPQICVIERRDLGPRLAETSASRREIEQALTTLFLGF